MAGPVVRGKVTLEVRWPKLVRARPLEALPGSWMLRRAGLRQTVIPPQDLGDRARRRDAGFTAILQGSLDLPPAPDVVAALTDREHLGLDRRRGLHRTDSWSPRPLRKTRQPFSPISFTPFVGAART